MGRAGITNTKQILWSYKLPFSTRTVVGFSIFQKYRESPELDPLNSSLNRSMEIYTIIY